MRGAAALLLASAAPATGINDCPHPPPGGGNYEADFAPVRLPTAVVAGLLPSRFALAPELAALPDVPVLFGFGRQSNVCDNSDDKSWLDGRFFDLTYHEFMLTVPGVILRNPTPGQATGPLIFTPRLYLNDTLAMVQGWVYGEDKALAHFSHTEEGAQDAGRWDVTDWETGKPTLSFTTAAAGAWAPVSSAAAGSLIRLIATGLDTAIVGSAQGPPGAGSGFVTCFDRHSGWADAEWAPVSGALGVHRAFMPGIPTGVTSLAAGTGFRIRTTWQQSFPNDCTVAQGSAASLAAWLQVRDALPAPTPPTPPAVPPHDGPQVPRPECTHPPGAGGGGGAYIADFIIVPQKTKIVEAMLPPELQLPLELRLLPYQPMIYVYGFQYGVCNNADGAEGDEWLDGRAFNLHYNEFIMATMAEFKDKSRPRGSYTFQPQLFLNDSVAMTLGWGFGINKQLARFEHDSATAWHKATPWEVRDWDTNELTMSLDSKSVTPWIPIPDLGDEHAAIVSALRTVFGGGVGGGGVNTPILGVAQGGQFNMCGVFDWQFFDHAKVQITTGRMGVHRPFLPKMEPFNYSFGVGVRVWTNWTMSFPNDCSAGPAAGAGAAWRTLRGAAR